jgi:transcriptional regulator with XRE-family HTH domain
LSSILLDEKYPSDIFLGMKNDFAKRRDELGLTQMEMAIRTGLSIKLISNLETGTLTTPKFATRRKLSEGYGVPTEEIPGGSPASPTLTPSTQ